MIKAIFKEIAEKEQGVFHFQDSDYRLDGGVQSPNVNCLVHFLNSKYNITCKLLLSLQAIACERTSISHLSKLFLTKKSRFKIKAENENITYFLKHNKALYIQVADGNNVLKLESEVSKG